MTNRCRCAIWMSAILFLACPLCADENDASGFAERVITLTDVVLDNRVEPPTPQEMILAGVRRIYHMRDDDKPVGLSRRISESREWQYFADESNRIVLFRFGVLGPSTLHELHTLASRLPVDKVRGIVMDLRGRRHKVEARLCRVVVVANGDVRCWILAHGASRESHRGLGESIDFALHCRGRRDRDRWSTDLVRSPDMTPGAAWDATGI